MTPKLKHPTNNLLGQTVHPFNGAPYVSPFATPPRIRVDECGVGECSHNQTKQEQPKSLHRPSDSVSKGRLPGTVILQDGDIG